jgi:hypothetical protein
MTRSTANNKSQSFVYHGVVFFVSAAVPQVVFVGSKCVRVSLRKFIYLWSLYVHACDLSPFSLSMITEGFPGETEVKEIEKWPAIFETANSRAATCHETLLL